MPRRRADPVAPKLFELVAEWSVELVEATKKGKEGGVGVGTLTTFASSFFEQFFENVMTQPVPAITRASKVRIAMLRNELKASGAASKERRLLLTSFEQFCDVFLDVSAELSAESEDIGPMLEFHEAFMRRFMKRIIKWAQSEDLDDIEAAATTALEEYDYAILEGFGL